MAIGSVVGRIYGVKDNSTLSLRQKKIKATAANLQAFGRA